MSARYIICLFAALFPVFIRLSAQDSTHIEWGHYRVFQEYPMLDTSRSNELWIRFNNANFFKNNEFQNDFVKGQTLTGLFIEPSLDFHTASHTLIRVGLHGMKFHGTDRFDRLRPAITLQHQVNPHFNVLFGTLYSTTNHGLLEPIMGFEKYLTDHYENGMQFLFTYPRFRGDVWLNWEQFIHPGDPFQEHFTAGTHLLFPFVDGERWTLYADMQMLFRHKGGEIDSSDLPAGTQSNLSQGLEFRFFFKNRFFRSFSLEHYLLGSFEINPGGHLSITEGYSGYSMAALDTRLGLFRLGYWTGQDYFAPHADPLFLSQSSFQDDYYAGERHMLVFKYQIFRNLTDYLKIGFRFEPYYHFYNQRLDHSWSLYLLLDKDFRIKTFGNE